MKTGFANLEKRWKFLYDDKANQKEKKKTCFSKTLRPEPSWARGNIMNVEMENLPSLRYHRQMNK